MTTDGLREECQAKGLKFQTVQAATAAIAAVVTKDVRGCVQSGGFECVSHVEDALWTALKDAASESLATGFPHRGRVICAWLRHAERAEKKEMVDALHSWLLTEMLELILGYC